MNMARRQKSYGFTLVEILVALTVLAIGMASVVALILGSTRMSSGAIDKNTAALILSEAIEDISRIHLITKEQLVRLAMSPAYDGDAGLYVETWDSGSGSLNPATNNPWPNLKSGAYAAPLAGVGIPVSSDNVCNYRNPAADNTYIWPPRPTPKYYGGPLQAAGTPSGTAFRAIYRIERHPDWIASVPPLPNPSIPSAYEGVYVLTLAVYKDLQPKDSVSNPNHKYEQVTDPVVVYLRKKS